MNKKNEVIKPVLQPEITVITLPENNDLKTGECIVVRVDAKGNEIAKSEFTTSIRMWERTFSNNPNFKLKKK